MKYLSSIHIMQRDTKQSFHNAYSLMLSLLCFFLLVQILCFVSIYTMQSFYLIQCNRQSNFDLACLSYARHIIDHNSWIRKCHGNTNNLIINDVKNIYDKTVIFQDFESFISIQYDNIFFKVYYDDNRIIELAFD